MRGLRPKPALPTKVMAPLREVTELLIKTNNLHEGHWSLGIEFGQMFAFNARMNDSIFPACLTHIKALSLLRQQEPNELTVDAAEVNPRPRPIGGDDNSAAVVPGPEREQ